jgi:hypothetical protein
VGANVVDREDVRMGQRGGRTRLLLEALQPLRVGGQPCGQNLDGDIAMETGVTGSIDLAHSTCTELADDVIGPEMLPCHIVDSSGFEPPPHWSTPIRSADEVARE